jgi:acetoin utilization deacetylase AcuC-like enzyme
MATVGLVGHGDFQKHDTGGSHPERPERLQALHAHLDEAGLTEVTVVLTPRHADEVWLEKVHTPEHVANVKARCAQGIPYMEDFETMLCPLSFDIARLAVGATFEAVDAVMGARVDSAFCAVRPPGHHAERDRAMGFCLFDTVVIAARYIQETYNLERVVIIDWDVHHGNGTQHILEADPSVFYFSVHQYPHYPGTGSVDETGIGAGQGFTLNAPVPSGTGDDVYVRIFDELLLPVMETFRPEFVIISAGFDAHVADPLSGTQVTESGFAEMTKRVMAISNDHADGHMISVLEGGYDLGSLSRSVEAHLKTLMDG